MSNLTQSNQSVDLSSVNLTDLTVSDVDIADNYWTPKESGESKLVVVLGIEERAYLDQTTKEVTNLPTLVMMEQKGGEWLSCTNASKRLIGCFENKPDLIGQAFKIEFQGKKRNSTNSNSSDTWKVNMLIEK